MAGNIHGHGQTRHMGGHLLNGKAQAGGPAAEALRADAGLIDGGQQFAFEGGIVGVRVGDVQRAEQSFFCLLYTSPSPRD